MAGARNGCAGDPELRVPRAKRYKRGYCTASNASVMPSP